MRYISKKYLISDALPSMILSKDIVLNGRVALSAGTQLSDNLLNKLNLLGVKSIDVLEETGEPAETSNLYQSTIQQQFFNQYDNTLNIIKEAFDNIRYFDEVPIRQMQELAQSQISVLSGTIGVINHLHMVRRQDDYTFHHSINVAIICGILGKWLGYVGNDLHELILAGLLHDSGKSKIPLEILNKPGKLSPAEMEIMKLHSVFGYKLIREMPEVSNNVSYGVLQHHERFDGSGYPFGITSGRIHQFAKIVAVADSYDAMTSDRVYRNKLTPFAVVEIMVDEMYNKLDPAICAVFLNNVRDYFTGNIVQLNDGREAEVIHMGHYIASRPIVKTKSGDFIDLEKEKNLSIIHMLDA
jgi:HD-GYP domain-containing protein (c-di-GMP phosphodiesterase class II)